jgi:hypothetical protein
MPEEHGQDMEEEPVTEAQGPEEPEQSILETREGRGVRSLAHILAILQVMGLMILMGAMVSYHAKVSEEMELRGYSTAGYGDVVETSDVMVGPWILGVPALAIFVGSAAYGLWTIRGWGRRLALILSLILVCVGLGLAHMMRMEIDQTWLIADAEMNFLEGVEEDTQDMTGSILKAATGLSVFYGLIFGLLMLPTVGRVFRVAEEQLRAKEAKFKIREDESRDHFAVDHDVAQL